MEQLGRIPKGGGLEIYGIRNVDLKIPTTCPEVPPEVLIPRNAWKDPSGSHAKAKGLVGRFIENFQQFASNVPANVREDGPRTG